MMLREEVVSKRGFVQRVYANASNALRYGSHSVICKQHHICLYSPVAEHHRGGMAGLS